MPYSQNQALRAARDGRAIHMWDDSIVGLTTEHIISTDSAIYYNIPAGKQVVVSRMSVGLDTTDDDGHMYIAGCSAVAGGGDATQLGHHIHYYSGSKKDGRGEHDHDFSPPLVVKYSDGHRSISLALAANDTDADLLVSWSGWVEDEGTLS